MILHNKIEIVIRGATVNYWKNKGYVCSVGDSIYVRITDLPEKSNVVVECICDLCNREYRQRRSRDLNVCGHCKLTTRLKGNKLGTKNKKYKTPPKKELLKIIESGHGKQRISKTYKVSIPVVQRWLEEYQIVLSPYQGRKYFKTEKEKVEFASVVKIETNNHNSISSLSQKLTTPTHIIHSVSKEFDISLPSQFRNWESELNYIKNNIDYFIQLNKKQTLKDIAENESLSIEQLKKAFRETNTIVRSHSYNKSKGELEVRDFIRSLNLECYSFKLNKIYEVDCFVPSKNFGVEYCGEYWHKYLPNKDNKYYHRDKANFMENNGIKLMTIFESEWKSNQELLKSMIKSKLGLTERIFARKCTVSMIDTQTAIIFHKKNHINKSSTSSVNYGLFYRDELVSVLSFIKSRFDKNYEYEISRYSTLRDITIVGGFSKLFSTFIKEHKPKSCMTYADLRFGRGEVYLKSGFTLIGKTPPNYHYFNPKLGYIENRMKFQKSMLTQLPGFAPNKTEFEIMHDSGYFRLYDCGNKKYGWRP